MVKWKRRQRGRRLVWSLRCGINYTITQIIIEEVSAPEWEKEKVDGRSPSGGDEAPDPSPGQSRGNNSISSLVNGGNEGAPGPGAPQKELIKSIVPLTLIRNYTKTGLIVTMNF